MKTRLLILTFMITASALLLTVGCGQGYQNSWLYPDHVKTVYVEMFDTTSFYRGHEFTLTDAVCKRIEAQTPYKIVSDRNIADTVLSGRMGIHNSVLSTDYESARPIEKETLVSVGVTWKDLKTGQLLIEEKEVFASTSYAPVMGQTYEYSVDQAVNKLAVRVVELMETPW